MGKQKTAFKPLMKDAWKATISLFPQILSPLFFTFSVWVTFIAIAFVYPISLLLSFPFLFAPSCYAFLLSAKEISKTHSFAPSHFFLYFTSFFSRSVFGSFRFLGIYMLSLLLAISLSLVFAAVYSQIAPTYDAAFSESYAMAIEYLANGNYASLSEFIDSNASMSTMFSYTNGVFYAVFLLFFLHCFLRREVIPFVLSGAGRYDAKAKIVIYSYALKQRGSGYNASYFSVFWPVYLLAIAFFALALSIFGLAFSDSFSSPFLLILIGLCGSLFGLLLLLPYYAMALRLLTESYAPLFKNAMIAINKNAIEQLALMKLEAERQSELAKKELDKLAKKEKENENENKENDGDLRE